MQFKSKINLDLIFKLLEEINNLAALKFSGGLLCTIFVEGMSVREKEERNEDTVDQILWNRVKLNKWYVMGPIQFKFSHRYIYIYIYIYTKLIHVIVYVALGHDFAILANSHATPRRRTDR